MACKDKIETPSFFKSLLLLIEHDFVCVTKHALLENEYLTQTSLLVKYFPNIMHYDSNQMKDYRSIVQLLDIHQHFTFNPPDTLPCKGANLPS